MFVSSTPFSSSSSGNDYPIEGAGPHRSGAHRRSAAFPASSRSWLSQNGSRTNGGSWHLAPLLADISDRIRRLQVSLLANRAPAAKAARSRPQHIAATVNKSWHQQMWVQVGSCRRRRREYTGFDAFGDPYGSESLGLGEKQESRRSPPGSAIAATFPGRVRPVLPRTRHCC